MGTRYTQNNFYITDDEALDARQGPFDSVSEALTFIKHRYKGLSVYVLSGGSVVEYWFKDGITDGDLIVKSSGGTTGSGIPHGTASGTDTYTISFASVTGYNDGDAYLVRFTNGNTTGCTLNINSLGAKTLYRNNDGALIGGDIVAGGEMLCIYNSTLNGFQAIGTAPNTLLAYITNADSVTLTKGMPVYAFGGTGDRLTVKRAKNTGDSTSAQTIGLVFSTSIATNQKGLVMMQGLLDNLSILPTSTWSDGDAVYLGATDGSITKTKPYAPNHLVYLGFVTTASNGNAGRMYVRVQNGYELDELHNVQAQSPNNKDSIFFDSSDNQWKSRAVSATDIDANVSNTEFSYLDGVTSSIQTQLNGKQATLTNPITGTGTNNEIAAFNSTGSTITSLSTATYPSLTELSYGKGVTSAIQTQLNTKANTSDTPKVLYRLPSAITIPANTITIGTVINIPRSSVSVGQMIEIRMIASTPSTPPSAARSLSVRWNGSALYQTLSIPVNSAGAQNGVYLAIARVISGGVIYARGVLATGSSNNSVNSPGDVGSNITVEYYVDPSNQTLTLEHITVTIY